MTEQWGPWMERDGKGCPCIGEYVQADDQLNGYLLGLAGVTCDVNYPCRSWNWANAPRFSRIIRYRIRRPKGMEVLDAILKDVLVKETVQTKTRQIFSLTGLIFGR